MRHSLHKSATHTFTSSGFRQGHCGLVKADKHAKGTAQCSNAQLTCICSCRSPAFVQKLQARSRQQYKRAQKRLSASQAENISPTSDGADPSPNSDVKSYHANAGLKIHQASSADAQAIASLCSEVCSIILAGII